MTYSNDVLNGYNDLFMSAHRAMEKNAGLLNRIGKAIKAPGRVEALERRFANMSGEAVEYRKRLQESGKLTAQQGEQIAQQGEQIAGADATYANRMAKEREALNARHTNEMNQYNAKPGALSRAQWGKRVGLGVGAAGLAAAPAAYYYGNQSGAADKTRTRNIAFGAGAAAGLALPSVTRGLMSVAGRASRSGLLPEAAGLNFGNLMGGGGQY